MPLGWHNPNGVTPRGYLCGYCNHRVGPNRGWNTDESRIVNNRSVPLAHVYICSYCGKPTFIDSDEKQYPGAPFGDAVGSLPPDVEKLYNEARSSMTVNAFTAAVLTCRKLLMHIAVANGAPVGQSFLDYVTYLANNGYVPPNGKGWVDYIRTKGNEANHEIKIMLEADGKDLITFSEMLLKFVYEFPAKVQPPAPANPAPAVAQP